MKKLTWLFVLIVSCTTIEKPSEDFNVAHGKWESKRLNDLKAEDGFLNLAGLFWMSPGEHSFGASASNELVFPEAFPDFVGKFFVTGEQVVFTPVDDEILIDSQIVDKPTLIFDLDSGMSSKLTFQNYKWFVIERAGNIGVRLKDLEHPALREEISIPKFPLSPDWVIEAEYVPYKSPKKLKMENVIGYSYEMEIPGQLQFEIEGRELTLEPMNSGDKFFIIFSDETSAVETYGAGRYLYASKPIGEEKVMLNFNRAYNPPCAFSDFATCLLPPSENQLAVRIEAGEKEYHLEGH